MALFRWIRSHREGKLVAAQVDWLLARTAGRVREASLARALTLAPAEARGYVRAKATSILATAVERIEQAVLPPRLQPIVLRAAVDRMTIVVLEQVAARKAAERPRRRAA
jgi:hypothetical protein